MHIWLDLLIFILCLNNFPEGMTVHYVRPVPTEVDKVVRRSGNRVRDSFYISCGKLQKYITQ